jgi:drug/metabolite transporter (DMT)-like permease
VRFQRRDVPSCANIESAVTVSIGLSLALLSAIAVNWAYTREHQAATSLPPLSPRNPVLTLRTVAQSRAWLVAFGAETGGWLLYVAAVRLAPLALVQAVSAAGIAVLALLTSRGRPSRLPRHEQLAVLIGLVGLLLLAVSLTSAEEAGREPSGVGALLWLAASAGAAAALIASHGLLPRAAALGLAAGLLFAAGDISTKLMLQGGLWFVALVSLVVCYMFGTSVLQSAFQHGAALTAAGIATLTTNAIPIAAGIVLFREPLPEGPGRVLRIVSFGLLVVGAAVLAEPRARPKPQPQARQDDTTSRPASSSGLSELPVRDA